MISVFVVLVPKASFYLGNYLSRGDHEMQEKNLSKTSL